MPTLTALLNDIETAAAVLQAARLVSTRMPFDIRAVHTRPVVDPSFMPTEEIMTDARRLDFAARQETRSAALARIVEQHMPAGPPIEEIEGALWEVLETVLARSDLVAIGTACGADQLEAGQTITRLLRQRRIPVLVVPPTVPASVGARPGIVWKPGLQIDAAIASVGQLLRNTDQIHILRGDAGSATDVELDQLTSDFVARGIRVHSYVFDARGQHAGRTLVAAARQANCDLLVMGAHTHGWLHDALFQGLADKVVAEDAMPVLLHA